MDNPEILVILGKPRHRTKTNKTQYNTKNGKVE
jgi:hypothetical protein